MKDHFGKFIMRPKNVRPRSLGQAPDSDTKTSKKCHLAWLLVTSLASFTAWKVSKWHSSYEELQRREELGV